MELLILRFIQQFKTPFLDFFFETITSLGETAIICLVLGCFYWAISKSEGEYLGKSLMLSLVTNCLIKNTFRLKRPIGEEGIVSIRTETATGYSFPSGHSQMNSTLYSGIYFWNKSKKYLALAIPFVILIGLSRLYLGVHYPKDVLVGLGLGVGISYFVRWLGDRFYKPYFLALPALMVIFGFGGEYLKYLGLFYGFALGIAFEKKFVGFATEGISLGTKIARVSFGIISLGGVALVLNAVFPKIILLSVIKYFIITFYAVGIYPYLFYKAENRKKGGEANEN